MKNFINLSDINKKDLRKIIEHAKSEKKKTTIQKKTGTDIDAPLKNKVLIMIFEKPSTRTEFHLSWL